MQYNEAAANIQGLPAAPQAAHNVKSAPFRPSDAAAATIFTNVQGNICTNIQNDDDHRSSPSPVSLSPPDDERARSGGVVNLVRSCAVLLFG